MTMLTSLFNKKYRFFLPKITNSIEFPFPCFLRFYNSRQGSFDSENTNNSSFPNYFSTKNNKNDDAMFEMGSRVVRNSNDKKLEIGCSSNIGNSSVLNDFSKNRDRENKKPDVLMSPIGDRVILNDKNSKIGSSSNMGKKSYSNDFLKKGALKDNKNDASMSEMGARVRRKFTERDANSRSSSSGLDADIDDRTVGEVIASYANDWKLAYEFFSWVETHYGYEHKVDTYNSTIDILGKVFEFDLAWDLIEGMGKKGVMPTYTTFRIMLKRYAVARMVEEAVDTYRKMEKYNLKDESAFMILIDALCEWKHVIKAEELCLGKDSMYPLDTKKYNILLRGWFKLGWWSKCREFWEEMDQKGIVPDLHSYTIYMDILSKSGKPWKAVKLYKEMKKKGIVLDIVAYNTALHALGLAGGVDEAIHLYREMLDLGCQPSIVTFNTIIKLLCQSGRLMHAYLLLEQMPQKGFAPNAITYHCFFASLNEPKEILGLFEKMIASECHPRIETYVMLIRKFGRWGYLRPIFLVWKTMEEFGCSPDEFAYNALIDALIEKGMFEMARKYDEEMLERGLSGKLRQELQTMRSNKESVGKCG